MIHVFNIYLLKIIELCIVHGTSSPSLTRQESWPLVEHITTNQAQRISDKQKVEQGGYWD